MNVLEGDAVAQMAHFFSAWAITFTLAIFFILFDINYWISPGLVIAGAFVKELLEALGWAPWEPKDTFEGSFRDFKFFVYGSVWALLIVFALASCARWRG